MRFEQTEDFSAMPTEMPEFNREPHPIGDQPQENLASIIAGVGWAELDQQHGPGCQ